MEKVNVTDNRFSTDITIPCYDTDASFRLKPAAFMDHAQEMAYLAAGALHFGYEDLQKHHTAWVLSRMRIDFPNLPVWTDETTLYTWHKGLDGLFFLRDFELRRQGDTDFRDKSKVLVACTSSWIVMNVETRRLVRSDEVLNMVPANTRCSDNAILTPCGKVVMPKNIPARRSDATRRRILTSMSSDTPTTPAMWSGRWTASTTAKWPETASGASVSTSSRRQSRGGCENVQKRRGE